MTTTFYNTWSSRCLVPFFGLLGVVMQLPSTTVATADCTKNYMENTQLRLEKCILENYKSNIRPTLYMDNYTNIHFEFAAMEVRFNSQRKLFSIIGIIKVEWTDEFLAWNPEDYGGVTVTQVDSKHIWTPPLYYEGPAGTPYNTIFGNTLTDIRSDGNVSYMNFVTLKAMCTSQLSHFPRDEHECQVTMETFHHLKLFLVSEDGLAPKDFSVMEFGDMMMSGYTREVQTFEMLNVSLSTEEYPFEEENSTIPSITITAKIRRNTSRFSSIYLKALTIGLLVLVPLLVPVTSVPRMVVPLITFFGSLYSIDSIDNIISIYTADDVPFIIIYYRNIILLSLFILVESFVYLLLSENPLHLSNSLDDLYCQIVQHDVYGYLSIISSLSNRPNVENESLMGSSSSNKRHTFQDFMQVVDTFLFYLIILVMSVFYLQLLFG
ncbi:hypothetical protein M8J75_004134 [Diaphorina citri]|nr:hypothetical protein M8J75_004134 [Diaphorina citri]